jgi:hypothetical protein
VRAEPASPVDIRARLLALFPAYRTQRESSDNPYIAEDGFSHHGLMIDFTEILGRNVRNFSEQQIDALCRLIDAAVSRTGPLENAVSSCLLEHLQQTGAWKTLGHRLSNGAR